jgi:hypothetical protein
MRESCRRTVDHDDGEQHQQQQVVVLDRSAECAGLLALKLKSPMRNGSISVDALRTVGDVERLREVVHEDAHDLAEAERDDGEVVAAQAKSRRSQHGAGEAGHRRADRQDDPERQVQAEMRRGQQRIDIGADGEEGHVAEVEQAGEADHDVEAEREQANSTAKLVMRTQAVPAMASTKGRAISASAMQARADFSFVLQAPSCPLRDPFAEQAGGPEHQHQDQHQEGEHILVVAAEQHEVPAVGAALAHPAAVGGAGPAAEVGEFADVAGAQRLDQPQQQAADHGAGRLPMPPSTAAEKALRPSMKPIV